MIKDFKTFCNLSYVTIYFLVIKDFARNLDYTSCLFHGFFALSITNFIVCDFTLRLEFVAQTEIVLHNSHGFRIVYWEREFFPTRPFQWQFIFRLTRLSLIIGCFPLYQSSDWPIFIYFCEYTPFYEEPSAVPSSLSSLFH